VGIKEKRAILYTIAVLAVFVAVNLVERMARVTPVTGYDLPLVIGPWLGSDVPYDREQLIAWLGMNRMIFRNYTNGENGKEVSLYIAYYVDMMHSDKAHAPEVCYPGQGWSVESIENIDLTFAGKKFTIKRFYIEKNKVHQVVYSWWQTRYEVVAANEWYRLAQVKNRLMFRGTPSLWVRVSAEYDDTEAARQAAEKDLNEFCRLMTPFLAHYLEAKG